MKLRAYGMVLSLLFALGLVFSFSIEASASHGDDTGITAEDVDPKSRADVETFLDHIIDYYNQEYGAHPNDQNARTRAVVIYGRQIRREGTYKYFENSMMPMYSMGINKRGIVTNHAGYPNLFGYEFNSGATDSEVASTIQTLITHPGVGLDSTECQPYGNQDRVACATKVPSDAGEVTVIAGLHHAEGDSAFMLPDCTEFSLGTNNAKAVFDDQSDDNLVAYVKGVIGVSQQLIADITAEEFLRVSGGDPTRLENEDVLAEAFAAVSSRLFDKAACFGAEEFKHKSIYAFIMDANPAVSTVLFNGNNFDLNGTNLELDDDSLPGDDKSIAGLFNRALEGETSAYANYRWDDPETDGDEVEDFFRDKKVPGTSCKRSYIEVADLNERTAEAVIEALNIPPAFASAVSFPEQPYIFGSGTYPGEGACASGDGGDGGDSGDDGCAIARAGHTSQSMLLNLFLVASVLFPVVFMRRRV